MAASEASIELYWLPLGAGGWFVRLNGRIYEAIRALLERRRPLNLYHSALWVQLPEGSFVIENCWPIPDTDRAARGVVVQGPVASHRMARWRAFRYEVRRWRDGIIEIEPQPLAVKLQQRGRLLVAVPAGKVAKLRAATVERTRRTLTPEELKSLAWEMFLFCEGNVLQGTDTVAALAKQLAGRHWFLWWD